MAKFVETPNSYLKRILPDLEDLCDDILQFKEDGDRNRLVRAEANLRKINKAFEAIGRLFDAEPE
jgi:hypothetical protein